MCEYRNTGASDVPRTNNKNLFPKSQRIILFVNNCDVKPELPDALNKLLL